jgi:hypothetical protein
MSGISINNNPSCTHTNHLFSHPFCKEQSRLRRIANVAFHALTFGIPLAIYHVVSCCYSRTGSKQKSINLQAAGINSVQQNKPVPQNKSVQQNKPVPQNKSVQQNKPVPQNKPVQRNKSVPQNKAAQQNKSVPQNKPVPQNKSVQQNHTVQQNKSLQPYPILGQKALDFARKKLKEHPEIAPKKFSARGGSAKTNQPTNPEIALLTTLYFDVAFKNFKELIKQNKVNPWNNQEVIKAADECMKIAYAISNLTLDDLKSFTDTLSSRGDNRTYVEALTRQDSYQYRTFYYCTSAYHWLRGEIAWSTDSRNNEGLRKPHSISKAHANAFYQKETIQNSWNELYNNYCDRIRLYVNEEELRSTENRHFTWTQKDIGIKSFRSTPDSLPT